MNRLLDVWETLFSFSKYFLSNTFSQNIDNCSAAFSLLFSIYSDINIFSYKTMFSYSMSLNMLKPRICVLVFCQRFRNIIRS